MLFPDLMAEMRLVFFAPPRGTMGMERSWGYWGFGVRVECLQVQYLYCCRTAACCLRIERLLCGANVACCVDAIIAAAAAAAAAAALVYTLSVVDICVVASAGHRSPTIARACAAGITRDLPLSASPCLLYCSCYPCPLCDVAPSALSMKSDNARTC